MSAYLSDYNRTRRRRVKRTPMHNTERVGREIVKALNVRTRRLDESDRQLPDSLRAEIDDAIKQLKSAVQAKRFRPPRTPKTTITTESENEHE